MDNALSYYIPHHGRPKISLLVPESFRLNVCPAACGRRVGIRALNNGEADRQAFLTVTEADVISGGYESAIGDAVAQLLGLLSPAPRAFLIYVNCIDDFLGTDEEALLDGLHGRFPGLRFAVCHIDPVAAQDPVPPGARMQDRLYALLEPFPREESVNLIGNFVSPDPAGELYRVLARMGIPTVRELHALDRYEEFRHMAGARLNLVLMEMGRFAAENMEKRLGRGWMSPSPTLWNRSPGTIRPLPTPWAGPCPTWPHGGSGRRRRWPGPGSGWGIPLWWWTPRRPCDPSPWPAPCTNTAFGWTPCSSPTTRTWTGLTGSGFWPTAPGPG